MTGASARSNPTDLGLPSGGISQSSGTRVPLPGKAAGTIATVLRFTSMVATKWRSPATLDRCDERLSLRERTEVNQRGDASRGERAGRKAQAPPECGGSATNWARGGLRGQGGGDAIPDVRRRKHVGIFLAAHGSEALFPTPRPGAQNWVRARCAVRPSRGRCRRARPAHIRRRAVRRRASRYGRMCRSLLQACLQLEHGAADPALHGAERHLHARREILIGAAVKERTAQRGALM